MSAPYVLCRLCHVTGTVMPGVLQYFKDITASYVAVARPAMLCCGIGRGLIRLQHWKPVK